MLRDAERYDKEGEGVEASDVELLISLLAADIPHHVAKDQEEQDAL